MGWRPAENRITLNYFVVVMLEDSLIHHNHNHNQLYMVNFTITTVYNINSDTVVGEKKIEWMEYISQAYWNTRKRRIRILYNYLFKFERIQASNCERPLIEVTRLDKWLGNPILIWSSESYKWFLTITCPNSLKFKQIIVENLNLKPYNIRVSF
jgi:hypothetical protein